MTNPPPPSTRQPPRLRGSLPNDWDAAWGSPSPFLRRQLGEIRQELERLAERIPLVARQDRYGALVGSGDLRMHPVHRWYYYKEAYSPLLPQCVRSDLGVTDGDVADVFGGVATTALSLQGVPGIDRILSVEYSPFAQFAGSTKLAWPRLEPARLRRFATALSSYEVDYSLAYPSLAAFDNPEIFSDEALATLVTVRERIRAMSMRRLERDFFTLGLAAVIEAASGAKKDGRALRVLRGRSRPSTSLTPRLAVEPRSGETWHLVVSQWAAMIEDLDDLRLSRTRACETDARHMCGDARDLGRIKRSSRHAAFVPESIGWSCFSPPYLNCIDYCEVYKLELWLLEFVQSQHEFRELRLGTLRSHPSVAFPERAYLAGALADVVDLIQHIGEFVERHGMRTSEARMIPSYFDDMYRVFTQQMWILKPGGWMSCVVGNSTFARRVHGPEGHTELWRIPLLTDVLLAALARVAGFEDVEIWTARDLRPRNVRSGTARESIVVARKPRG